MKVKKINSATGCPKIDIYINGDYFCSTDWSKTLKGAIARIKESYKDKLNASDKVAAIFDRD